MKSMNNKFIMLLVLAVGSSQINADHHHGMCPDHKEHREIHRLQTEINQIKKNIEKHGAGEKAFRQLNELDEQAKSLCESCHKEDSHMCNKHERTLHRKIENARKLANKHKKEVKQKESKQKKVKPEAPKQKVVKQKAPKQQKVKTEAPKQPVKEKAPKQKVTKVKKSRQSKKDKKANCL